MSSRTTRWLALLIVAAACLPYLPTIDDYFTQDDFGVIQLLSSRPWTMFPKWFAMPWTENIWGYVPDEIRPFVALSYQISAIPGGARPELHHLVNIAIHAGNALLVAAIARAGGGLSLRAAAFAGVVFAVLPVQAESVAWITGRVDSMPAFFYFATFLAYVLWRRDRAASAESAGRHGPFFPAFWYLAAVLLFFVALFSKQNTITMVVSIAAYDLLVLDRRRRGAPIACVIAWLPFALMTGGYLGLRRALFGASVRGGLDSADQVVLALGVIGRHLLRTVFGHAGPVKDWETAAAVAIVLAVAAVLVRYAGVWRAALCLGIAWWVVGAAPVLVAGYESPRHVYLASAGWAFLLGLLFHGIGQLTQDGRTRLVRAAPLVFAGVIVGTYAVRLHEVVATWGILSRISHAAVERVEREAAAAPEGSLLLVGVPQKSWEWSAPFVLQPPFTSADFSRRVLLVTPFRLHCCGPEQWDVYTRRTLQAWLETPGRPPVIALHFAPVSGAVSRLTEAESPELRLLLGSMATADSWQTLDASILGLLERVVRQ